MMMESQTRDHLAVGLLLLLSCLLASPCDAAASWRKQQVALHPSLAIWTEAAKRCAAMGQRLAPRELAAQAAADGLLGAVITHQCTPHSSDTTVLWVDVGDGAANLDAGDQCQGLAFNHTQRRARVTADACNQRHCFLCSAPEASSTTATGTRALSGRRLMVADSTNCNMKGQQLYAWSPDNSFQLLNHFPRRVSRAAAPLEWRQRFKMGGMGGQDRLPVRQRRVARGDL